MESLYVSVRFYTSDRTTTTKLRLTLCAEHRYFTSFTKMGVGNLTCPSSIIRQPGSVARELKLKYINVPPRLSLLLVSES